MSSFKWCLTINNCSNSIEETLEKFKNGKCKCAVVGDEQGESGTRHHQAYVNYGRSVRFNTVKKLFPTAHIEKARGTDSQNLEYCTKEGRYVTYGEFKTTVRGREPKDIVRSILDDDEQGYLLDKDYIRKPDGYQRVANIIRANRYSRRMQQRVSAMDLYEWQVYVFRRLISQNGRQILWVSDSRGGMGKSYFARWLHYCFGATLLDGVTSTKDIVMLLPESPKYIIFDVTRYDSDHISYQSIEACKNGYIMTGKYQGYIKKFDVPYVLVLSNIPPKEDALSKDRIQHIILNDETSKRISHEETKKIYEQMELFKWPTHEEIKTKDDEEDPIEHDTN